MQIESFKNIDKELIRKGFSFLIIRVIGLFAAYGFVYIIAKKFGADSYGLVSLSFMLFILIGILGRLGLDIHLVKFYSQRDNSSQSGMLYKVLLKAVVFSTVISTLTYLLRFEIANHLFKKPELADYIIWVAYAIPFWTVVLVCAGYLRGRKQNNWFAFLNNPGRFIFSVLMLIILLGFVDHPMVAIKAHFYGVGILALLALIKAVISFDRISFVSQDNSWKFLKEAFPMMISSTTLVLLGWLDTFVLGIYESSKTVGIYDLSLRIAILTSFVLQAINSILAPKLANSYLNKDMDTFNKLISASTKLNFFLTLIIVLAIILLNDLIFGFFGEEFKSGKNLLIILCLGQLVNSISGPVAVILQMTGYQKNYQNIVLFALLLNIVLNFTLTPIYGAVGAAIATVISMSSWNLLGALAIKKKLKINSFYIPFK